MESLREAVESNEDLTQVSIPVRGRGYGKFVKMLNSAIGLAVSIPVRGRGYGKDLDKRFPACPVPFPSPLGEEVMERYYG